MGFLGPVFNGLLTVVGGLGRLVVVGLGGPFVVVAGLGPLVVVGLLGPIEEALGTPKVCPRWFDLSRPGPLAPYISFTEGQSP